MNRAMANFLQDRGEIMKSLFHLLSCLFALFYSSALFATDTPFYDDFSSATLDSSKWLVAYRQWGGADANGGVIPQNVRVQEGKLIIEGHGDRYTGPLKGINKDRSLRADGKRVGGAIATKDYFGSGSYEVRMKILPKFGVSSAIWTFHYQEYYPGHAEYVAKPVGAPDYYASNHEIDIEMPGRPGAAHQDISFSRALFNTWTGENDDEYRVDYNELSAPQDDGQFHTYRFDWHTGGNGETARVDFYVDGVLEGTNFEHIPTKKSRLWIAAWFPDGWAGTPDFDTDTLEVDWVRITPFNEPNDETAFESFPNFGWADADPTPVAEYFFEDFDDATLDSAKWKIAKKNWGGQVSSGESYNGGVIPENVILDNANSQLILRANGNQYTGPLRGINKDRSVRVDGKRTGSAIATAQYFASGSYSVRMKVAPVKGVCSALWTFHYQEFYPGSPEYIEKPVGGADYYAINHEIDIELPGRPLPAHENISFDYALFNTWQGENDDEYTANHTQLATGFQDDGQFHTYRFDWYTGDTNESARVEFYIDDVLEKVTADHVPNIGGRFWISAWFPQGWAGIPNFDTADLIIDWVEIIPFNEDGDRSVPETFPNDGWADLSEYPVGVANPEPPVDPPVEPPVEPPIEAGPFSITYTVNNSGSYDINITASADIKAMQLFNASVNDSSIVKAALDQLTSARTGKFINIDAGTYRLFMSDYAGNVNDDFILELSGGSTPEEPPVDEPPVEPPVGSGPFAVSYVENGSAFDITVQAGADLKSVQLFYADENNHSIVKASFDETVSSTQGKFTHITAGTYRLFMSDYAGNVVDDYILVIEAGGGSTPGEPPVEPPVESGPFTVSYTANDFSFDITIQASADIKAAQLFHDSAIDDSIIKTSLDTVLSSTSGQFTQIPAGSYRLFISDYAGNVTDNYQLVVE